MSVSHMTRGFHAVIFAQSKGGKSVLVSATAAPVKSLAVSVLCVVEVPDVASR